jgi:cell division protein ZapA
MAQVTVKVNGRSFRMVCREGEEARVQNLAAEIEGHVQRIKGGIKSVPDDRLFLMVALLMADQLWEAREELQRFQKQAAEVRPYQVIDGGAYVAPRDLNKGTDGAPAKVETLSARAAAGV